MQNIPIERPETSARKGRVVTFRQPSAQDGATVWHMVAACPPLDRNSLYCNLLQCTHFAETCVLAERDGEPIGWVSGYRPPDDPSALFIWQVAVRPEGRGMGLAKTMILSLLTRPACKSVERIKTTITPDNDASWALFRSIAGALNAPIGDDLWFDANTHFEGRHDSEHLVSIGPFRTIIFPDADQPSDAPRAFA